MVFFEQKKDNNGQRTATAGSGGVEVHMESFPSQALRWRVGISHQLSKLHSAQAVEKGGWVGTGPKGLWWVWRNKKGRTL